MDCPKCGSRMYVIDSRGIDDFTYRRYRCSSCDERVSSAECIITDQKTFGSVKRAVAKMSLDTEGLCAMVSKIRKNLLDMEEILGESNKGRKEKKMTKTCVECQWYDCQHLLCVVGGDIEPTDCACDSFIPIKPPMAIKSDRKRVGR